MRTSLMIIFLAGLVATLAVAEARVYKKINNDYIAYVDSVDRERDKRQTHADATIARLPVIPFADPSANEAAPSAGGVAAPETAPFPAPDPLPFPAEYLTPPALDPSAGPVQLTQQLTQSQLTQAPQQPPPQQPPPQQRTVPQPSGKWDLGFEASEVLVPPLPEEQAAQYDTLKLFTLLPTSSQPQDVLDSFGVVEQEPAADSRMPFIDSYSPNWVPQNEPIESTTNANNKVYTFVKTDPHGHFKWGVHIQ